MHVITRKRLNEFSEKHPDAKSSLARWYVIIRKNRFLNFAQLRETFPHADQVGKFTVFNIGGTKFDSSRPCIIIETRSIPQSRDHVLTHPEYDAGKWKK